MQKTIVVTRPKGDEEIITQALQDLGHFVIHEPLTEIFLNHTIRGHLQAALEDEPAAIIATSRHAVQALALLSDYRDLFVLCVGNATAELAISLGFTRVESGGGDVESLLEFITSGYDDEAKFLYISGEHIRSDLPLILESFGMQCNRVIAYQAIATEALSETLVEQLKRGQIDAISFFSPRNAKIFCELLEESGIGKAASVIDAFCFSEDVAEAADDLDWNNIIIPTEPTLASLIDSVDNSYSS